MREKTYYIGKIKVIVTSNTPSDEALSRANAEINRIANDRGME